MRQLPVAAFVALVVATIAAFFITQHLKVATPLIQGAPTPLPAAINPLARTTCLVNTGRGRRRVDFWQMKISFYLQNRSDDVGVYIVDQNGNVVRALATDQFMRGGAHPVRRQFIWDGRRGDGSVAPDGTYYVRVHLIHQDRWITISNAAGPEPVEVLKANPRPVVTRVVPSVIPRGGTRVTIRYRGTEDDRAFIQIYRTDIPGAPREVKRFAVRADAQAATWDGKILHRPAPAGTYLVGLQAIDSACNAGSFPARGAPAPLPAQALLNVAR